MKEIADIVDAHHKAAAQGMQTALATVVHLQGSAYRRPGARMLVTDQGQLTGAISGGCLEGDALRKAQQAMAQHRPMLVTYDTTDDEDGVLGVGLGCNGIISVLIEPIDANQPNNPIQLLEACLQQRQSVCIATLFSLNKKAQQPGTCLYYSLARWIASPALPQPLMSTLHQQAAETIAAGRSSINTLQQADGLSVFLQAVNPALQVLVFGAGNDCMPLVDMAALLGWQVTVIDGRTSYATAQRFPKAYKVVVARAEDAFNHLQTDGHTVALLMTHNYNYDGQILRRLAGKNLPYIGVLGPRKKTLNLAEEMRAAGVPGVDAFLQQVYGPAGIDLGSETPEEIALSIIAEIKAVLARRPTYSLRDKEGAIHQQVRIAGG